MQSPFVKPKLFLFALAGLWLCWCVYAIASFKDGDLPARSDCAIVLGAAVYGAAPSPVFEERIRHALDLYRRGLVRKLIFTGGAGPGARYAESTVAATYAARAGGPCPTFTRKPSHTRHVRILARPLASCASAVFAVQLSSVIRCISEEPRKWLTILVSRLPRPQPQLRGIEAFRQVGRFFSASFTSTITI